MSLPSLAVPTRLPLREPPYDELVAGIVQGSAFTGLSPGHLRQALAHHPRLAQAFLSLAQVVLFQCELPEREREIAIIRTGALTRSEYEWGMHVSLYGERCGLGEDQLMELTQAPGWQALPEARWTPSERLIVRMVDELHHHHTVADATWRELSAQWPRPLVLELLFASAVYHLAAMFLNAAGVPLEAGARRFPPGLTQAHVPDR